MALCRRKPIGPLQTLATVSPLSTIILDIPEKMMEERRLSQKQQHFVGILSPAWLLWDHPAYFVALAMVRRCRAGTLVSLDSTKFLPMAQHPQHFVGSSTQATTWNSSSCIGQGYGEMVVGP